MISSDDYQIRSYELGEEQEIVELLSEVFVEWKARGDSAIDHWRWKYQDTPLGPQFVSVALKDDEIVGVSHDLQLYVKVGDDVIRSVYSTDAAVHPDHRRRGLNNRMRDLRKLHREGTDFRYRYTTNKILIERNKRKIRENDDPAFLFPIDVNRYLLINDIGLHLEKKRTDHPWLNKIGYLSRKAISSLYSTRMNFDSSRVVIREGIDYVQADRLWDKIKQNYKFIIVRNKEFLEWRFMDPRAGEYIVLSGYIDGEYSGYIVVSIDHETLDYPMGNIIDFFTEGNMLVDRSLIHNGLKWLNERGVNAVSTYAVKDSHVSQLLDMFGFIDRGDSLYAIYQVPSKPLEPQEDIDSSDENQIHLMYADFYVK